jgi:hypothetical protein
MEPEGSITYRQAAAVPLGQVAGSGSSSSSQKLALTDTVWDSEPLSVRFAAQDKGQTQKVDTFPYKVLRRSFHSKFSVAKKHVLSYRDVTGRVLGSWHVPFW